MHCSLCTYYTIYLFFCFLFFSFIFSIINIPHITSINPTPPTLFIEIYLPPSHPRYAYYLNYHYSHFTHTTVPKLPYHCPSSNRTNVKSGVSALSSTSTAFGTAASNARLDQAGNGHIDEALRQQALAEEEAAMNQYKVRFLTFKLVYIR